MKYTCKRCCMSFHVVEKFDGRGEIGRCGEPARKMHMQSGVAELGGPIVCRVLESTVERLRS